MSWDIERGNLAPLAARNEELTNQVRQMKALLEQAHDALASNRKLSERIYECLWPDPKNQDQGG